MRSDRERIGWRRRRSIAFESDHRFIDRVCEQIERAREITERLVERGIARGRPALVRGFELRIDGDESAEQLLGPLGEHEELLAARAAPLSRPARLSEDQTCALERAAHVRVMRASVRVNGRPELSSPSVLVTCPSERAKSASTR